MIIRDPILTGTILIDLTRTGMIGIAITTETGTVTTDGTTAVTTTEATTDETTTETGKHCAFCSFLPAFFECDCCSTNNQKVDYVVRTFHALTNVISPTHLNVNGSSFSS